MGTGGSRFGAGRPGWRRKCEQALAFDIRKVARCGRLTPGQYFSWNWTSDGEHVGSIAVRSESGRLILSYQRTSDGDTRAMECTLWIHYCRGGYGSRPMFSCPRCGKLSAVVYFGGNAFACRKCLRLGYASEAEDAVGRLWRKQRKIESRLIDGGAWYQKPKGMHWQTFNRLTDQIAQIEERRDVVFYLLARPLLARMGCKLPGL